MRPYAVRLVGALANQVSAVDASESLRVTSWLIPLASVFSISTIAHRSTDALRDRSGETTIKGLKIPLGQRLSGRPPPM